MSRSSVRDSASLAATFLLFASILGAIPAPAYADDILPHDITLLGVAPTEESGLAANDDFTKIAFVMRETWTQSPTPGRPGGIFHFDSVHLLDTESGTTRLVSVASDGTPANNDSYEPVISADGTRIAFTSEANHLAPGDPDHVSHADVYLHDTVAGTTIRVSEHTQGRFAEGDSRRPAISADGTKIAYSSIRANQVPNDTNGTYDIFVFDTTAGTTTRVSLTDAGLEANGYSRSVSVSDDGTRVAFTSHATNLVPGDANGSMLDVFVRDTVAGTTIQASVGQGGIGANAPSREPAITGDGTRVAFRSFASNLVIGDTNGVWDVFVHDIDAGATTRASVASDGTQATEDAERPLIDHAGRLVAFSSPASSLLPTTRTTRETFVHEVATGNTLRVSVGDQRQEATGGSIGALPVAINSDGTRAVFASRADNLGPGGSDDGLGFFAVPTDCCQDRDQDGLDDDEEAFLATDPLAADTDADGLDDWTEAVNRGTDPLNADTDGDTLIDGDEWFIHYTSPLLTDSDGDGVSDADEVTAGTNPPGPPTAVGWVRRGGWDWRLRYEDGSTHSFPYGIPGDLPFMGDWDCDGIDTVGVFRPSNGLAYLRNSNDFGFGEIEFLLGTAGDRPLVGDWDGDGCDSLGLYRDGRVLLTNALAEGPADLDFLFGIPGDAPFTGDFDGDGATEIGVYRDGRVFMRFDHTSGVADHAFYFGLQGDVIVAGDWDNDGVDSVGVWRNADRSFYLSNTNDTGDAEAVLDVGALGIPVTGDFQRPSSL